MELLINNLGISERKLIVTSDDFGLTEGVNEGVIEAYRNGIVTRTSLVANGEAFDHAVSLAKENKGLKVGVHLTLIEETPINLPERIRSLVRRNGKFHANYKTVFIRYVFRKINMNEVYIEWESQIEKILNAGIDINHIDSHQHLHMLPGIFGKTIDLAKKYKINKIRLIKYELRHIRHFKELAMTLLGKINSKHVLYSEISIPDYFRGLKESGNLTESSLLDMLDDLPNGRTELMCHPGFMDPVLESKYRHWAIYMDYKSEIQALLSKRVMAKLNKMDIQLVS